MDSRIRFFVNEVSTFDVTKDNIKNVDMKKNATGDMYAIFDSILQTPGKNYNGRVYDLQFLYDRSLSNPLLMSQRKRNGWYGEANHPKSNFKELTVTAERMAEIDLKNTSHRIDDFRYENGNIEGTISTCTRNESGENMFGKISMGLIPSFSMRGFGYAERDDKNPYLKIDKLITYDWVYVPSHTEAYAKTNTIAYKTVAVPFKENGTSLGVLSKDSFFAILEEYTDEIKSDDGVKYFCESMHVDLNNVVPIDSKGTSMFLTENGGYIVAHATRKSYDRYNSIFR